MQYTVFVLIAVLSVAAAMSNAFLKGAGGKVKAPAAPKAAASSAPAAAGAPKSPKRGKKDMTWGGRPDPTPELFIDDSKDAGNWLSAGWRYNKKD